MATATPATVQFAYSQADLDERTIYRRAVEAAIWGCPSSVSMPCGRRSSATPAALQRRCLSKQADWRFQITTPNASSGTDIPIYLKNGPIVVEVPRRWALLS